MPSSSTPVTRPAPALPEPCAAAAIGVTETSRKKLVSMHNADTSTSANEPLTSRPRGRTEVPRCGAELLITATVGPEPDNQKVQFPPDPVIQLPSVTAWTVYPAARRPDLGRPPR